MIKIDKPAQPRNPQIYRSGENKEKTYHEVYTQKLMNDFENGSEIIINEKIYQHFKNELWKDIQHGKCCYCEAKIYENATHHRAGDVEHFRPKNGYIQDLMANLLIKPSYIWLVYDWDNLLYACQVCNNLPNKGNKFPLLNDTLRAKSPIDDIQVEEPYLINPSQENPEDHFSFRAEFIVPKSERGAVSIKILGLDRNGLNEQRADYLKKIQNIAKLLGTTGDATIDAAIQQNITDYKKSSEKFSAMIRANF